MKKLLNIIILVAAVVLCGCSDFNDAALRDRIDDYKSRIDLLKEKAEQMTKQLSDLSYLTNGNVVTSVSQDADGRYVVTYKDNKDAVHTVLLATADELLDVPVIGVKLDEESGIYYWTKYTDGETSWLTDDAGERFPVSGYTPVISVDADGYWTVDGARLLDGEGNPLEATTEATSVFRSAALDADGNLGLTLGDGTLVTLPVFNTLNLKLTASPVTVVADASHAISIPYELSGEAKQQALVAVAKAEGLTAQLDKTQQTITVTFDSGFTQGTLIVMAYDRADNVVVRPLFFRTSAAGTIAIGTPDELVAFATSVNNGGDAMAATAILTADIDLKNVTDWTPIGNATITFASNHVTITGNAFKGEFNGNGHTLKNLKLAYAGSTAGAAYGLFGVLDGATVKNLNIGAPTGDTGSLTVTASGAGIADTGVLAGVSNSSTVTDCISYIPMVYDGSATVRVTMALVGFAFGGEEPSRLQNLKNYGSLTADTHGNSANGLGTAIHVGGICGVASSDADTKSVNDVAYCDNYGDITSNAARTSGIVAAANNYTRLNSCVNHGNQLNTVGSTGRLGNITCITGSGCSMTDCINNGNLIATGEARCGGLVSLVNSANNSFSGCANYGEVISDSAYRGAFFGYNNVASSWVNCVVGGKVGVYSGGTYVYDAYPESNQLAYMGKQGSTPAAQTSNITYAIGSTEPGDIPEVEPTLRILFIGNSFTKDAVEHLPKMLEAAGVKTVKMVHMYYGGRTIPEYASGYASVSDYTCYRCATGSSVWAAQSGYSLHDVVQSDKWDIVTIQEHTGNSCAWLWNDTEKNAIVNLLASIKEDQGTNSPEFVYILSQAYSNMAKIATAQQPLKNFTTQAEMFDVIVAQAKKVLAETDVDRVISTGAVLQNLRTSSLNVANDMDLTRDGYHMDYGISRYAAACALFESLISPSFGQVKLDGNTFRYATSNTTSGSYSTPVTDANQPIALQAARYALADPYTVTNMGAATELTVNPTSADFAALGGSTQTLYLASPKAAWTTSYDAEWLKVNLSSAATCSVTGGAQTSTAVPVFITPDINTTGKVRTGAVTFTDGTKTVTVQVSQQADLSTSIAGTDGFPADWRFRNIVSSGGPWLTTLTSSFVAYNYATAGNGSGATISYVRGGDNSLVSYNRRTINASNYYPVIPGAATDDYWLMSIPVKSLPAGSAVDVFFPIGSLKNAPKYYIIEYFDNGQWKSVAEDLRTAVEDSSVKYTAFLTGNSNYARWISQTVRFSQSFSNERVLVRCRAVGTQTADKGLRAASSGTLSLTSTASSNTNISLTDGTGPIARCYGAKAAPTTTKKVLVIGNSFTFWNASPTILKELAYTDGGLYLKPYVLTRGSQTLGNWLDATSGGLGEDIISWGSADLGGYDYAIIQDQSQNPAAYAVNATASILSDCKAIADKIRAASPSCQVILEQTWSYPGSDGSYGGYTNYDTFDNNLWNGSVSMAQGASTWVSPIGLAFKYVRANYPSINLLAYESKHPSYAGSYLKSCVNYLLLVGRAFGSDVSDGELDAQTAAQLRTAAEKVVLEDYYGKASDYKR